MVSHRKRKKEATRQGLTTRELEMLELLEEVVEKLRWMQVLAHAQSFVIREKLKLPDAELDRVLEAATRAIDDDALMLRWEERLGRLKGEILEGRRGIRRERKRMQRESKQAGAGDAGG